MQIIKITIPLVIAVLFSNYTYALSDFYTQHKRGWIFFDEIDKQEKEEESITEIMQIKPGETATMATQRIQKAYDEISNLAIMNPTDKNIKRELEITQAMSEKAEKFATNRQEFLLSHPSFDPSVTNPKHQAGIHIAQEEAQKKDGELLAQMRDKIGLYFFFKESCGYCQAYSANIDDIRMSFGFEVFAVSMDRGRLSEYGGEQMDDNGISQEYNIQVTPTIVAVNPRTGKYAVITTGMVAQEVLIKNLLRYGKRLLDEDI